MKIKVSLGLEDASILSSFYFFAVSTRSKCALVIILSTFSCKIKCEIFCKILPSAGLGPCHCVLSCQAFEQESEQR